MTRFHIETYGCSLNFADSEQMAGLLKRAQFEAVENIEDADVLIINSCTVKSPTEKNFFKRLDEIKEKYPGKAVIIAGCIPQTDSNKLKDYSSLGTKSFRHIVDIVEETLHGNIVKALETGENPRLNLPKVRKNPAIEIIPISRGCLSACTFCKTKFARGHLQSYPVREIVNVARSAVLDGVREIWLTSQDCFCYGFDLDTNLPTLLKELLDLPGNFRVRVGMGNPHHLIKIKEELFPLLNDEKMFQFLHVPIQSGSNRILQEMKREGTKEEFLELVKELREKVPQVSLATDIIVGFPSETEEEYFDTLNLVREVTPDAVNISKFWARSKTLAAKREQLPGDVIKHRSQVLTDIFHKIAYMQNEKWIGWSGDVIVDEKGKEKGEWIGKNESYKQVIVRGDFKFGDVVKVRIKRVGTFDLQGEVISAASSTLPRSPSALPH